MPLVVLIALDNRAPEETGQVALGCKPRHLWCCCGSPICEEDSCVDPRN